MHVFTYNVYHFKYKFAGVGFVRRVTLQLEVPILINTLNFKPKILSYSDKIHLQTCIS